MDGGFGAAPVVSASKEGGVPVHLIGVVHLYRQREMDIVALRGVDLDVDSGEMVALLGPSGMGKSTVMRLMAGLIRASAGVVSVGNRDLGRLSSAARRALRASEISYIVQGTDPNLLPFATVIQNVWFAQQGVRGRGQTPHYDPEELLDIMGLREIGDARVSELPRGLQQQVALVAGVAPSPGLILADEPTSELSQEASTAVIALLQQINHEFGTTVVLVTHDPVVASHFPRTITIRDGRVGAEGHRGEEYAVVDSSGSIQLPPEVLELLPPNTRVRVVRGPNGIELHKRDPENDG